MFSLYIYLYIYIYVDMCKYIIIVCYHITKHVPVFSQ